MDALVARAGRGGADPTNDYVGIFYAESFGQWCAFTGAGKVYRKGWDAPWSLWTDIPDVSQARDLTELEHGNQRPKNLVADQALDIQTLK